MFIDQNRPRSLCCNVITELIDNIAQSKPHEGADAKGLLNRLCSLCCDVISELTVNSAIAAAVSASALAIVAQQIELSGQEREERMLQQAARMNEENLRALIRMNRSAGGSNTSLEAFLGSSQGSAESPPSPISPPPPPSSFPFATANSWSCLGSSVSLMGHWERWHRQLWQDQELAVANGELEVAVVVK